MQPHLLGTSTFSHTSQGKCFLSGTTLGIYFPLLWWTANIPPQSHPYTHSEGHSEWPLFGKLGKNHPTCLWAQPEMCSGSHTISENKQQAPWDYKWSGGASCSLGLRTQR